MKMKKVIIIGGGIAGLSAGIYACKNGFDVTILEKHHLAGGNCTSWKRGGYLFEGGMHWLAGSNPQDPLNQLWRSVGALNDKVTIHYNEPFIVYSHKGTPIRLFRDVNATEEHLLSLSPADEKEIKLLCSNIRKVQKGEEVGPDFYELSREQYAARFVHEGISELIRSIPGEQQGMLMLLFTLGSLAGGDGGFPEGGSLPFAARMVETYTLSGGKILYQTQADRVITEHGKVTGVTAGKEFHPADAVIITSDTMSAGRFFDTPLQTSWLDEMQSVTEPTMATLVSLGIRTDLKKYPERLIFKLDQPIHLGDQSYKYLSINNYASDPVYSPAGKSAVTIQLPGDTYAFWKTARDENRYTEEKQKLQNAVSAAISLQIPETKGKIEICDIATPLTYERYCGNWKGSWMTELKAGTGQEPYPPAAEGLNGVYFAGQRMMPPGGLPPALLSGIRAVQCLCEDMGVKFIDE